MGQALRLLKKLLDDALETDRLTGPACKPANPAD
jgi:hypothetical protein